MAAKTGSGFSDAERQAMKARAKELAAEQRSSKKREDGEKAVRNAIAEMKGSDRTMAKRIHELVSEVAPHLWPKTWYGMPAYANKDGKVICFFQAAGKFESRYASFGFNDVAKLDDGNMWPVSFALVKLTKAEEKLITDMVLKAVS
ncbi:MAG: hypothetical protein TR69_WS6001000230 [candidate division WS6 bacterium OLB20]|uniref:YdhG-like domain-containing protein n=1 Tax=candidate division WS6 bacterium OLB20 TaxID=1617426 RepID=A0A136M0C9_9BACT|nr:MAG: hypothetical protein TR69_WS6001000230 [candidate division WS6 bacterium OLB20]